MNAESKPPSPPNRHRKPRSVRRLSGYVFVTAAALVTLLLVFNLLGRSLYLYVQVGSHDLILAGSIGVAHVAVAEHTDLNSVLDEPGMEAYREMIPDLHTDLLQMGPIHLFTERPGELQLLRFHLANDEEYRAVEFPLLLAIGGLGFAGWVLLRRVGGGKERPRK